ncbi:MAG: DUF418 domain-containing protein [Acidobacteria bacterium]|nr:DUF418 domain-containing protein [Acidobacteriota bacterium]
MIVPAEKGERINSVDVLRGFALLGILTMNILAFGLPGPYYNPVAVGTATNANSLTWAVVQVSCDGKMRALFSMLFGGSVVLMTSRARARGAEAEIADIWLRRSMWLMAIGAAHAWLLWDGDILFTYGLAGLFLYPFRKLRPALLVLLGALLLATLIPKAASDVMAARIHRAEAEIAEAAKGAGLELTDDLKDGVEAWKNTVEANAPPRQKLDKDIKLYRSGYLAILANRAHDVPDRESLSFYTVVFSDSVGMMLIGMAMLRLGVFSAARSVRFYVTMAACGLTVGLPVLVHDTRQMWVSNFDVIAAMTYHMREELSRGPIALAWAAMVMIVCKQQWLPRVTARLAAVGQTALTNYVMQTVLCTTLFYGYGLGLYGQLERYQLYGVVAGVWAVQITASSLWLRWFRYGPLEWMWRSLTYWEMQPFRGGS